MCFPRVKKQHVNSCIILYQMTSVRGVIYVVARPRQKCHDPSLPENSQFAHELCFGRSSGRLDGWYGVMWGYRHFLCKAINVFQLSKRTNVHDRTNDQTVVAVSDVQNTRKSRLIVKYKIHCVTKKLATLFSTITAFVFLDRFL